MVVLRCTLDTSDKAASLRSHAPTTASNMTEFVRTVGDIGSTLDLYARYFLPAFNFPATFLLKCSGIALSDFSFCLVVKSFGDMGTKVS